MLDSNDLESVKMSAKLKIRSASVEDLGHIVKKMIDGVLEDTGSLIFCLVDMRLT